MTTPAARLTWLHFSDFHLRVSLGWAQDQVLSSLLRDVEQRYAAASVPDLLFFTGDIAFSGKKEEYERAEDFIRKVAAAVRLPMERVFVIPGNHDIDLDCEEDAITGARALLTTSLEVDRFLGNSGRCKTVFARQRAFREFANRLLPSAPTYTDSSHAHSRLITVGAIRVQVLMLDSTWLAGGGSKDSGQLVLGERQIVECATPSLSCLTFALMHHPVSWLREFEQIPVENLLIQRAHICLRGHVHTPDHRLVAANANSLVTFTAGAAFQSRTADNTYSWNAVDLASGNGEQVSHRYRHVQHSWEANQTQAWTLPVHSPKVDVSDAFRLLQESGARFPAYATCLVIDLQREVPARLTNGKLTFVAWDATMPGIQIPCGDVVRRLRNHFHWRHVWAGEAWLEQLRSVAAELVAAFDALGQTVLEDLRQRETSSEALLESLGGTPAQGSAVAREMRHLLDAGDLPRAREVLHRWRGGAVLRADEVQDLDRLEVFLLLAERRPNDAFILAERVALSTARIARDVAVAARCASDAGDGVRAAALMHQALDEGVAVDDVRTISRVIASTTGDKKLAERVR